MNAQTARADHARRAPAVPTHVEPAAPAASALVGPTLPSQQRLAELARLIEHPNITNLERQDVINTLRTPVGRTPGELEGYVLESALAENRRALTTMASDLAAAPPDVIVGMERGGAFLADVLASAAPGLAPRMRRIPVHRAPTTSGLKFDASAMQAEFQAMLNAGAKRIVIVDAYMGGTTASELRDRVLHPLTRGHGDVRFELSWLRELAGFEDRPAKGLTIRGNVSSRQYPVRLAIGDDMTIVFTPNAREPITVFARDGRIIRTVKPRADQSTRELLIELLTKP